MENKLTKSTRKRYWFWNILSILAMVLPLIIFSIKGFCDGTTGEHFALGACLITACIFVAINLLFKYSMRSTIWIVLVGIHCCIDNIMPLLITMMVTTLLDEFVFSKLAKKYKNKLVINKEIDKRS